jgi:hypothetical protein
MDFRGSGVLKILKHKETSVYRIFMRQNQTHAARANDQISYLGLLAEGPAGSRHFFGTAFAFCTPGEDR